MRTRPTRLRDPGVYAVCGGRAVPGRASCWRARRGLGSCPTQYATIQAAITASQRGDVIKVAGGTYTGNVTVPDYRTLYGGYDPTLTVRDPDLYPTVLDGGVGNVVTIQSAENVVVDGFEIKNSGSAAGVYVKDGGRD